MTKRLEYLFPTLLLAVFLTGCASLPSYNKVTRLVNEGSYEEAIAVIEKSKKKYGSRNLVLYYLDMGLLHHYAGLWEESNRYFTLADETIVLYYRQSFLNQTASFILNDQTLTYQGEDYEIIYIHFFKALNYLHLSLNNEAMVEVRRIDEELTFLQTKYKKLTEELLNSRSDDLTALHNEIPAASSTFYNSALARYVSMLLYLQAQKRDDVRIDYLKFIEAYQKQKNLYPFEPPLPLLEQQMQAPENNRIRLNIFAYSGQAPYKYEVRETFPLPPSTTLSLAFPAMRKKPSKVHSIVVKTENESCRLWLMEDMGLIAADTFKQKIPLIYLKAVLRAAGKSTAVAAASEAARRENENIGMVTWLAGTLFNVASERADLRTSRLFPGFVSAGILDLAADTKTVDILYFNKNNQLIKQETLSLALQRNTINIVTVSALF
jgi:hypothetical protein